MAWGLPSVTAVDRSSAFFDVIVDKISGDVFSESDAPTVGPGATPAVAALPSNGGALVAYTNGTSIYASVMVY